MVKNGPRWAFAGSALVLCLATVGFAWQAFHSTGVVVEWSTSSEMSVAGFNLYRSQAPDETGDLVTAELIPAQGNAYQGQKYTYTDKTANPGQVYWYWLEEVDLNGQTTLNGPIEVRASRPVGWILLVSTLMVVSVGGVWFWGFRKMPEKPNKKTEKTEEQPDSNTGEQP